MSYKLAGVTWNDDGTMANEGYVVQYKGIPIYETLKAFDIIKEKIDIGVVILGDQPKIRITYNGILHFYDISQEEYDILKEVLYE